METALTKRKAFDLGWFKRHKYLSVFLFGTLLYIAAVLPSLIYRGGFFYYYGDYNYQSIEFMTFAHRSIREGYLFWNPMLDWGADLFSSLGGYATSPFFFLLLLFPTEWVPYLLPFIMALRYGVAALTSFAWLRTLTRTDRAAFIGALLYAFSGFQAINIVFTCFHDVTAFFPLFMLAFDHLMQKRKGGFTGFVLMTALMCYLSLYTFFGQVVFIVIYFFVRYYRPRNKSIPGKSGTDRQRRRLNAQRFFTALFCGILGVLIVGVFVITGVMALLGNPRVGNTVAGSSYFAYNYSTTIWESIRSLFFMPEHMGFQKLFVNTEIDWGSVSLYLPCLSIAGVIAYFYLKGKDWKKDWRIRMTLVLTVMALVSGLNSAFSAFNREYYARWYYMFILILALVTVLALENCEERGMRKGAGFVMFCTAVFSLVALVSQTGYIYVCVISLLSSVFLIYLVFGNRKGEKHTKYINGEAIAVVSVFCCLTTAAVLFAGCHMYSNEAKDHFEQHAVQNRPELDMSEFARVEDGSFNWPMMWGYPMSESFLTGPTPSVFDVFSNLQFDRTQMSDIAMKEAGLRQILSTKYFIGGILAEKENEPALIPASVFGISADEDETASPESSSSASASSESAASEAGSDSRKPFTLFEEEEELEFPEQFKKIKKSDGLDIYENQHFIPMGFTFEYYISEDEIAELRKAGIDNAFDGNTVVVGEKGSTDPVWLADRLLVKDLVLSDEMIEKYGHLLEEDKEEHKEPMSEEDFCEECDKRAQTSCTSFSCDPDGYSAVTTLEKENLVFFSIPWDKGFRAFVDGEETEVEKVDFGFIAVHVPQGTHEIRLFYRPYWLGAGALLSLVGVAVFIILIIVRKRTAAKKEGFRK